MQNSDDSKPSATPLSRRSFLTAGSAGLATAALSRIAPVIAGVAGSASLAYGQHIPREIGNGGQEPLVLYRIIPMSAKGRLDHMTVDPATGRVFAAVYGNDTVDVLDVRRQREVAVISGGLSEPQGVAFVPEANRIVVSNCIGGACVFFDGTNYSHLGEVSFGNDSDQVRYVPAHHRVYVGYGDVPDGAIGMIDTRTWKKLPQSFPVGVHPESFQVDAVGRKIYVNLASIGKIAVIDIDTGKVKTVKLYGETANFPMALDLKRRRMFVGARIPANLLVFDMDTMQEVARVPGARDTDDLWYDPMMRRIYVSSGQGFVFVFQQVDPDTYFLIAKVPSAIGARTSAFSGLVKKHISFFVGVPFTANRGAELWEYEVADV